MKKSIFLVILAVGATFVNSQNTQNETTSNIFGSLITYGGDFIEDLISIPLTVLTLLEEGLAIFINEETSTELARVQKYRRYYERKLADEAENYGMIPQSLQFLSDSVTVLMNICNETLEKLAHAARTLLSKVSFFMRPMYYAIKNLKQALLNLKQFVHCLKNTSADICIKDVFMNRVNYLIHELRAFCDAIYRLAEYIVNLDKEIEDYIERHVTQLKVEAPEILGHLKTMLKEAYATIEAVRAKAVDATGTVIENIEHTAEDVASKTGEAAGTIYKNGKNVIDSGVSDPAGVARTVFNTTADARNNIIDATATYIKNNANAVLGVRDEAALAVESGLKRHADAIGGPAPKVVDVAGSAIASVAHRIDGTRYTVIDTAATVIENSVRGIEYTASNVVDGIGTDVNIIKAKAPAFGRAIADFFG